MNRPPAIYTDDWYEFLLICQAEKDADPEGFIKRREIEMAERLLKELLDHGTG